MTRILPGALLAVMCCGIVPAATTNTTLTVNATATLSDVSISAKGTATLEGIGTGTIDSTFTFTSLSGTNLVAPFTITLTSGDKITGNLLVPVALLSGSATTGRGSATITGGTGAYAGATGSFPSLSGTATGSITSGFNLTFSGPGTITTTGTGGGGGGTTTPTPTVSAVLDAASYTKTVAQGSIFVVKGTNLSASGLNQFGFPLPASSNGVKITFTPSAGGAGTDAYLVYTYNQSGVNQLAGILPSTVAAGNYNVTVTNGGITSAPFATTVTQRKPGLITQDSSGSGLVVAQNYISASQLDVDRFTTGTVSGATISPAKPGQVLIAWATGLGPVTGGDNNASPGFNFAANGVDVKVVIGGMNITPAYAGRAPGLAGADQINFTLPANVPTGCTVSFQISVNGVLSNPTFIAIAPDAASNACVYPGFTTSQLQQFDQGGSYAIGSFALTQITETVAPYGTVKFNSASGAFVKITGFQLSGAAQYQSPTPGACQVLHVTGAQGSVSASGGGSASILDAGAITLNGPSGSNFSNQLLKQDPATNTYSLTLSTDGLPTIPGVTGGTGVIVAGDYTLSGAGGKDVGKFSAKLSVGPPLTITGGLPAAVTRSAGLPLSWTGGNSTDMVEIIGYAGGLTGTGANTTVDATEFICITTAGQGGFTVPASILTQLPAIASGSTTGSTLLEVLSVPTPNGSNGQFTAPLTAGRDIDIGYFLALVGIGGNPSYQ